MEVDASVAACSEPNKDSAEEFLLFFVLFVFPRWRLLKPAAFKPKDGPVLSFTFKRFGFGNKQAQRRRHPEGGFHFSFDGLYFSLACWLRVEGRRALRVRDKGLPSAPRRDRRTDGQAGGGGGRTDRGAR